MYIQGPRQMQSKGWREHPYNQQTSITQLRVELGCELALLSQLQCATVTRMLCWISTPPEAQSSHQPCLTRQACSCLALPEWCEDTTWTWESAPASYLSHIVAKSIITLFVFSFKRSHVLPFGEEKHHEENTQAQLGAQEHRLVIMQNLWDAPGCSGKFLTAS